MAVSHASNVLGAINPADEIITLAHAVGAKVGALAPDPPSLTRNDYA